MMTPDKSLRIRYPNGSTAPGQPVGEFDGLVPLMEALRFTEDDLHANRQGRLGETQAALLRSRVNALPVMGLLMASLPITFVSMSLVTLASSGELSQPSDPSAFGLVIVILVIAALLGLTPLVLSLRNWRVHRQALAVGAVSSIEGIIEIEVAGRRCMVSVVPDDGAEVTFAAPRRVENAFDGCDRYRLYYVAAFRRIVAAECVDG